MVSPMSEPGNSILIGVIRKEQAMYFDPGVQSRRKVALQELYGGNPPQWKEGPKCYPTIVIPRIVPDACLPLLPKINMIAPRMFKDGAPEPSSQGSLNGSLNPFAQRSLSGSIQGGSVKSFSGSVRSHSSQLGRSQSDPMIRKAATPDVATQRKPQQRKPFQPRLTRNPEEKFADWVEEDVKFPFKRPG